MKQYFYYFAFGLIGMAFVLFALWLLDAPIMGGVPTQPDCALETAGCYETMHGIQIDLEMCESDLENSLNGIQVLQGQYDKAILYAEECEAEKSTFTAPMTLGEQLNCDAYAETYFSTVINESAEFVIATNMEVWIALHLVDCCSKDESYCEPLMFHLLSAEETSSWFLDESVEGWRQKQLDWLNVLELERKNPTS